MAFDRLIENIVKTQNPSVGYMGVQQDYNRRDTRYLPCYQATGCIL